MYEAHLGTAIFDICLQTDEGEGEGICTGRLHLLI